MVAEVFYLLAHKVTLAWFQLEVCTIQHEADVVKVLPHRSGVDQDIIDVNRGPSVGFSPWSTICNSRWKTAGALVRPNGITWNSNRPLGVIKAVFSMESSSTRICQYLAARSRVVKYIALPSWSNRSSILGWGKVSEHNRTCPGAVRGLNDSLLLHLCQLLGYPLPRCEFNPPNRLLLRYCVTSVDIHLC